MSGLRAAASLLSILTCASLPCGVDAQEYGPGRGSKGTGPGFGAAAPGVVFDALAPTVQRWYVPQELYREFQWRQWEHTNYSSSPYMRYVNTNLEGDFFYDFFGDYVSHGWLVYDWRQDQPQGAGSAVFKGNQFETWFSSVAISSDARGQNAYALTAGNRIRAGLTPMTFSKPTFNGVQFDFTSDKYAATLIASRISDPGQGVDLEPERLTSTTGLIGGRVTSQIGDFVTVGATLVDARNSNTALDLFEGNFFAGSLTGGQSQDPIELITVVLSDDSPEDGVGGASLFSHDILITTRDFDTGEQTVFVLEQVVREGSEWPAVFGGLPKTGFLAADGEELIVLNYDFRDPAYDGPDPTEIVGVEFDYVLANDYKVEVWSNRQTGTRRIPAPPLDREKIRSEEPALIALLRAAGNVSDKSNIRRVRFDYGLPTGNLVGGFTIEGTDLLGFDLYAEWDRNTKYAQFPNAGLFNARLGHETTSRSADAWHLAVSRIFHPFFLFGEGYSFHHDYSTSAFVVDAEGNVEYDNTLDYRYEFVDDNDDQDRIPDWSRSGSLAGDRVVFPGWDANNDFISDFNQNDNSSVANEIPDYEEPFLRHEVDRPEFLFGPDLNNNGWIDRFEDDELPDYPYKTDRQGYNAYLGTHLAPDVRLTVGRTDERMFSDERRNRTTYGMLNVDRSWAAGRLRLYDMLKLAGDSIPDDRLEPTPFLRASGRETVSDVLPAQDTWINTLYLGFDYTVRSNLRIVNKLKHEFYGQRRSAPVDLSGNPLQESSTLYGLINKAEYNRGLAMVDFAVKLKSELFSQESFLRGEPDRRHWMRIATLIGRLSLLSHSTLTAGLELAAFDDRGRDEAGLLAAAAAAETGDFRSANLGIQLSNTSNYQGYVLTTQLGFRLGRISTETVRAEDGVFGKVFEATAQRTSFIVVYAGVE